MRLIDADALIVKLYQDQPVVWTDSDAEVQELNDVKTFMNMVNSFPTVYAVKVVRCKDCLHSYDDLCGLCCTCGPYVDCVVQPDFYCADGKRKRRARGVE